MFDRIMGKYLLDSGRLTKAQLSMVYQVQESKRAKLGVIAVTEMLMTVAQAEEINALQATMDKRFGDLAIERGYLSEIQVGYLLSLQGNEFQTFTSALVEKKMMTLEEVDSILKKYQLEKGLNDNQMAALKSGDIDLIVPIFTGTDDPEYNALFKYGIKNVYRLVDTHLVIDNVYTVHNIKEECIAYQCFDGEVKATIALVGKNGDLQKLAKSYTKEEFIETEEDALDAMCELINCINGLYATDRSRKGKKIELDPPYFITKFGEISGEDIRVMPIYSCDAEAWLVVSVNSNTTVK
ncbi:chemotaxis protein CheX [Butyrivibrio sp. WCE2006]|uniref:chemotaxis protein CheX n=1 Tax=Butyrivibrio sp. WCE2006 TaxID=1410611 RepID=UPI0005D1C75B|nr:chemotaxis protein CheX [Butyrivibrio sp. WCE2006]